jgi:hypothetical protein
MASGVNPNTPVRLFDTHPNRRIAVGEEVVMIDHEQPNVRGLVLGYAAEDRLWVKWPTVTSQEDVHDVIATSELGNVVSLRDTGVVVRPQSVHTPGAFPKKTASGRKSARISEAEALQAMERLESGTSEDDYDDTQVMSEFLDFAPTDHPLQAQFQKWDDETMQDMEESEDYREFYEREYASKKSAGMRGARFSFRKVRKGGGHAFEVYVGDNHVGNIRQKIKSGKRFWKCEGRKREKLYATRKEAAEALCARKKCGSIRLCGEASQIKLRQANPQGQYPQNPQQQQPLVLGGDPQFADYNLGITMDEVFGPAPQQPAQYAQPRPAQYAQPLPAQQPAQYAQQPAQYAQQPAQYAQPVQPRPQRQRMGPYGSKMELGQEAAKVDLKGDIEDVRPHRLRTFSRQGEEENIQMHKNAHLIRAEGVRELDNMLRVLRAARRPKEAKIASRIIRTAMILHMMHLFNPTRRQASDKSVTKWWKRRLRTALSMTKKLRKLNQGRYASVADRIELALQKSFTYPTTALRMANVQNPPTAFQTVFGQESFKAWDELLHRAKSQFLNFDPMQATYEQIQPIMVQMQKELQEGGVRYTQIPQVPEEPAAFNLWHQQQSGVGNPLVTG